jgi:hypothetical protein
MKARCENWRCDWRGDSDEMLRAKHPFDETDEITGCPKCKQIGCVMGVCDEPGCWEFATCGTLTERGYRNTCGKHRPNEELMGGEAVPVG